MRRALLLILSISLHLTLPAQESIEWRKGDSYIKLHGFISVNTYYDFTNSIETDVFTVSKISTDVDNSQRIGFDPYHTRIGVTVGHKLPKVGDVKGVVEIDFRGASNTVRLRLAYLEMFGFVAGQDWSFFTDTGCNPPLLDINGGISRAFFRTQLLGYRHSFGENFSLGASIENPIVTFLTLDGVGESISQSSPDVPMYVRYDDSRGHVKLASIMRWMNYGVEDVRQTEFGWGLQVTGNYAVIKPLRLYFQGIYGKGIARYINDMNSQSLDLIWSDGDIYQYNGVPMWGAAIGFNYDFHPQVSLICYLSGAEIQHQSGEVYDELYHKGLYVGSTLQWCPISKLKFGLGYFYGEKVVMSGDAASANRLISTVLYYF